MAPVQNICTIYKIHTDVGNFFVRNGNLDPGTCFPSDAEGWPSWILNKGFSCLSVTHERDCSWTYAAAIRFDIAVKVYVLLFFGIFLYFNFVFRNTIITTIFRLVKVSFINTVDNAMCFC